MSEESTLKELSAINLGIAERLLDPEFRREWFRAELEASVPEAFRELRERREMTQGALAVAIGTKQPAICRFEKSTDAVWEFAYLLKMAEAMDARLRVVVEASEDVIAEYEAMEAQASTSSALDKLNSGALPQRREVSALASKPPLGNQNEAREYRDEPRGVSRAPKISERPTLPA